MKKIKLGLATLMLATMSVPLAAAAPQTSHPPASNLGICIKIIGIELCIGA